MIAAPPRGRAQTAGAAFLDNDHSPLSFALGMSDVMTSRGAQAVGANPANLGTPFNDRYELYTSYAALPGGANYGHLAASIALRPSRWLPLDAVGAAIMRTAVGQLAASDASGNLTGTSFGADNTVWALSGSGHMGSRWRLGGTAKAIQETIAGYTSNTALAGDIGATCLVFRPLGISMGAALNNWGQRIGFLQERDALPTSINVGAAAPMGPALGVVTAQRMLHAHRTDVGVGMAYALGPLEFRGGYLMRGGSGVDWAQQEQSPMSRAMNGISGGIGLRIGALHFDYAVSAGTAELGMAQRASLTLQWGHSRPLSDGGK